VPVNTVLSQLSERGLVVAEHITAFAVVPVKQFKSTKNVAVSQVVIVATYNGDVSFLNVFDIEGSLMTTLKIDEIINQIIKPQSGSEMVFATLASTSVSLYKLATI
jgi:hypothetical protein